jgi:hypothetical protein
MERAIRPAAIQIGGYVVFSCLAAIAFVLVAAHTLGMKVPSGDLADDRVALSPASSRSDSR